MTSQNNSPVSRIEAGESWQIENKNTVLTINSRRSSLLTWKTVQASSSLVIQQIWRIFA